MNQYPVVPDHANTWARELECRGCSVSPMPRFYFHLHERGAVLTDEIGRELSSRSAAYDAALLEARSIMANEVLEGRLDLSLVVEVWDDDGLVFTVPFRGAVDLTSDA